MSLFFFNISVTYWKTVVLMGLFSIFVLFLLWLVVSYYFLKWFKMKIDNEYVGTNDYNNGCKKVLGKYGNCKIRRLFLVRQPVTKVARLGINLVTFYNFEKEMEKYNKSVNNDEIFFPKHASLMVNIEMPNKIIKSVLIEKNQCVQMHTDFSIYEDQEMLRVSMRNKNYTINSLLKETRDRIGNNTFFNWHICRNNCQVFIKELLVTLGRFNKTNEKFIYQREFAKKINIPDFSLHIINGFANAYATGERFIGGNIVNMFIGFTRRYIA